MPKQFIFLISPRTHLLDLAGSDQVLNEAIFYKAPFEIHYCSYAAAERREGGQAQQSVFMSYRNHIHAGIHAVQDHLVDHLDLKHSLPQLAELANMSTRNFTRIFKKETGIAVGDYITLLRKEKIGELLKNPDLSRAQLARQVGLGSERQLKRLMK